MLMTSPRTVLLLLMVAMAPPVALRIFLTPDAFSAGAASRATPTSGPAAVREMSAPAPEGSGMYSLAPAGNGDVYLSWVEERAPGGHALRFSRLQGDRWSTPATIAEGGNWFANWADHPSIAALPDGSLVAHWLVHNEKRDGDYAYGLRIARSTDGGARWKEVYRAGADLTRGYAGFVTLLPLAEGFGAAYLRPPPGAAAAAGEHEDHLQTLRYARFGADGSLVSDDVLDTDACSCCPTDAVVTADGPVVVYRDHAEPVRDIAIVRSTGSRWSAPAPVNADGWEIPACPTNGPAIDAAKSRAAIAWFTAAGDLARVNVAFSTDAGRTFGAPVRIDGGSPVGWAGLALLDDGSALASWLESKGDGQGEIRVRRVRPDGGLDPPIVVATAPAARSAGVPQLVRSGGRLAVAWRTDRVRVATIALPGPGSSSRSSRSR
jgi:hypothetical protein